MSGHSWIFLAGGVAIECVHILIAGVLCELTLCVVCCYRGSVFISQKRQRRLSGYGFINVGLPPASPSGSEDDEDNSTLFLLAGYARYNCPYVWVSISITWPQLLKLYFKIVLQMMVEELVPHYFPDAGSNQPRSHSEAEQ